MPPVVPVAGTWSVAAARVRLEPFPPLPLAARRELDEEARRLAAFLRRTFQAPAVRRIVGAKELFAGGDA